MKKLLSAIFCAVAALCATAQQPEVPQGTTVYVWPDGAPNAFECCFDSATVKNNNLVYDAQMVVFPAENPNGKAVLCFPGGGYAYLAKFHEGLMHAPWFNEQGITFAVLLYRMPCGHADVPLSDVQQAMRILRNDPKLGIKQLGVMGSSAGGHLAATAATHFVDSETRPDFQILFYPVISMDLAITHQGSHDFLMGADADKATEDLYSNELQVTAETPRAFIMHCTDDDVVPIENSNRYYQSLEANGLAPLSEYWIFPSGGHGWGCSPTYKYYPVWAPALSRWLSSF